MTRREAEKNKVKGLKKIIAIFLVIYVATLGCILGITLGANEVRSRTRDARSDEHKPNEVQRTTVAARALNHR